MATNKIYDTLLYAVNKKYKGRVISMNRKEKDTIILKSILKMNNTNRKNKYIYIAYTMRKTII